MDNEHQTSLFDASIYEEPLKKLPEPETVCAQCEHIIGMKFSSQTLYFCSFFQGNRRYGRYGKKIKKSSPACWYRKEPVTEDITVYDGYYGGVSKTTKRVSK